MTTITTRPDLLMPNVKFVGADVWNEDVSAFKPGHYGAAKLKDGAVVSVFRDLEGVFFNVGNGAAVDGVVSWRYPA